MMKCQVNDAENLYSRFWRRKSPQEKLYSGGEFLLLYSFPTGRRQGELALKLEYSESLQEEFSGSATEVTHGF